MSLLTQVLGLDAAKRARHAQDVALAESQAERKKFRDAETAANEKKTRQQQRINAKSANSARNSLRRPGFLDSSQEGISDVLG